MTGRGAQEWRNWRNCPPGCFGLSKVCNNVEWNTSRHMHQTCCCLSFNLQTDAPRRQQKSMPEVRRKLSSDDVDQYGRTIKILSPQNVWMCFLRLFHSTYKKWWQSNFPSDLDNDSSGILPIIAKYVCGWNECINLASCLLSLHHRTFQALSCSALGHMFVTMAIKPPTCVCARACKCVRSRLLIMH